MLVGTPPVHAKQYRAIGVLHLPEVVVGRPCLPLTEERLIPREAARHIGDADDRPRTLHGTSCGLPGSPARTAPNYGANRSEGLDARSYWLARPINASRVWSSPASGRSHGRP